VFYANRDGLSGPGKLSPAQSRTAGHHCGDLLERRVRTGSIHREGVSSHGYIEIQRPHGMAEIRDWTLNHSGDPRDHPMDNGKLPVSSGLPARRYRICIRIAFSSDLETTVHSVQLHRIRFRMGNDPGDPLGAFLPGIHPDRSTLAPGGKTVSADGTRGGRNYLLEDSPGTNRFETIF